MFVLPLSPALIHARAGDGPPWLACMQVSRLAIPHVDSTMERCATCGTNVWASRESVQELARSFPLSSLKFCCLGCSPQTMGVAVARGFAIVQP